MDVEEDRSSSVINMKIYSKKGQLSMLSPGIIALVFAGIILVFGLIIAQSLRDIDTINDVTRTITNETGYGINDTALTIPNTDVCGFNAFAVTAAWNATNGTAGFPILISSGNYTTFAANGTILGSAGRSDNYTTVNLSYTFRWGDQACIGANDTVVGLGTFADFWEIIVLAIVIGVVISLLLVVFGGRGRAR